MSKQDRRNRFWDSFDGHAGERLASFIIWVPLIFFGLVPIMLATGMSNPLIAKIRVRNGLPEGTKWMTIKWRLILMGIAFVALLVYNFQFSSLPQYVTFLNRWTESLGQSNSIMQNVEVVVFYLFLPLLSLFFFIKSILEVAYSRGVIKGGSALARKISGSNGISQTVSIVFYFSTMCLIADGTYNGVLDMSCLIVLCDFYFVAAFPWVFRKTEYDHKADFDAKKG